MEAIGTRWEASQPRSRSFGRERWPAGSDRARPGSDSAMASTNERNGLGVSASPGVAGPRAVIRTTRVGVLEGDAAVNRGVN